MNLYEYQAKKIFLHYGLPTPIGFSCTTPREAEEAASKISTGPWVVKCQILAGGRSKAGGVMVVKTKEEIRAFAEHWLGKRLQTYQTDPHGEPVQQILVEEVSDIKQELYLGAVIDRSSCRVVFMASIEGGVEIEEVSKETPHLIHKVAIDPLSGPMPYQGRKLAFKLGLKGMLAQQFTKIFMNLAAIFLERDLALLEINPLVITSQGNLICLDGKLSADKNALFRQPDLRKIHDQFYQDPREAKAAKWKLNYLPLYGNIACIVNGAGLAMSTMDIVKLYGGEPANFLDVGGAATKAHITEAFKIILSDNTVKAVLVNIFGGIVRCDMVADGIISALGELGSPMIPVVVRLAGNNAVFGEKKLAASNLNVTIAHNLTDAAQLVIGAVKEK